MCSKVFKVCGLVFIALSVTVLVFFASMDNYGSSWLRGFYLFIPVFIIGCICITCGVCMKRRGRRSFTACFLVIILPFLPCLWVYHSICKRSTFKERHEDEDCIDQCCILRRPGSRRKKLTIHRKKFQSNEGFSWYLHSYLVWFIRWGCCVLKFTKDMSLSEAIHRYDERPHVAWNELLEKLKTDPYLRGLIEYLNMSLPKFYFRILPSGSIRERFGYPLPSTSILASDYDLMFVPDAVYVYDDEMTNREDRFPASFIAVDDPNQNPERKTGHLWLKLAKENSIETWKDISYERMDPKGGKKVCAMTR